jgi:hypothetical protein
MSDLTVIFMTNNELPEAWAVYHRQVLLEAIGDSPLITVSRKPMRFGFNLIQTEPKSPSNVYFQLLRAAKIADTKYIAMAEDDTLYHSEHFTWRPTKHKIGYNMNHWSLFTWDEPVYNWRNRRGNYSMIGEREFVIECLEERFAKYPDGTPDRITGEIGRDMVEHNMGITVRRAEEFQTTISIVNFNHDIYAMDETQRNHRKRMGLIRAYEIPFWGRSEELVKHFK